jgi:hypothetical protein
VISLTFRTFSPPKKRMPSISALSPRVPVRCLTHVGMDLPLTTLISIAGKRNKLLTCTQETTRAKLERIRSARLIHDDHGITTRHAKALIEAKALVSLLAPIKYYY